VEFGSILIRLFTSLDPADPRVLAAQQTILDAIRVSHAEMLRLFRLLWLFLAVFGCFWLFLAIFGCFGCPPHGWWARKDAISAGSPHPPCQRYVAGLHHYFGKVSAL
jgi:hypothetical protein